jgi:hypothetical protein
MTAGLTLTPGRVAPQQVLLAAFMFLSAIAIAQEDTRLHAPPESAQLLSDEIYEQAGGWREPAIPESEWRAPPQPQKPSRIKFGYDSLHEELRARDDARYDNESMSLRDPKPSNSQLRLQF